MSDGFEPGLDRRNSEPGPTIPSSNAIQMTVSRCQTSTDAPAPVPDVFDELPDVFDELDVPCQNACGF